MCDLDSVLKLNENVEMRERYLSLVTCEDGNLEKTAWPMLADDPWGGWRPGSSPDPTTDAPCGRGLSSSLSAVQGEGGARPHQRALPGLPVAAKTQGRAGKLHRPGTHGKVTVMGQAARHRQLPAPRPKNTSLSLPTRARGFAGERLVPWLRVTSTLDEVGPPRVSRFFSRWEQLVSRQKYLQKAWGKQS